MKRGTLVAALVSGVIFGYGLSLATMIDPQVVLSFLRLRDFGLLLVMGGALAVTIVVYQLAPRVLSRPLLGDSFGKHQATMDSQTIVGSAIFGIGWGICGVCPGPAIAGIGAGNAFLVVPLVCMFLGAYVQGRLADLLAPLGAAR
jgi:uncharacterized membrane protein YedE/YeeE